ncbi:MAG: SpoIIE family protein phosphatase [Pirellulaceae bacterium]|nr:SpoIIE family protein phosphatase [Pirellulaceae bacterium]
MAFLIAVNGPETGKRISLDNEPNVLGRHPECDVVVPAGAVSRHHARISQGNDGFYLEDLKSRNGTLLNHQPLSHPQPLKDGDKITICELDFSFHLQPTDSPANVKSGLQLDNFTKGSNFSAILVDDGQTTGGESIVSKLNLDLDEEGQVQYSASPEVKLNALLEITKSLGRVLSLDEVLPQVLDSLFKIFVQADRGFLILKQGDGHLVPKWSKFRQSNHEGTARISQTILQQVMAQREAILSADAATDSRFEMSQSIVDFRIRSMMCAPLINSDNEVIGVIQIDTLDQKNRFNANDLEVLASVAAQAAISIENGRMHDEAVQQKAVEQELEVAHRVQLGFLPTTKPALSDYDFFNYYQPANHIGGDYFDYLPLTEGRVAIIVADVVGHGIAAALLMAKLAAEIRFCLASESDPAKAITRLNNTFSSLDFEDRFVTLVMTILDPEKHAMTIVNAGHMSPLVRKPNGELFEPGEEEVGIPLGVMKGFEYEQAVYSIGSHDQIVLYTDGINECMNAEQEIYGLPRLRQQVTENDSSLEALGEEIVQGVQQFLGEADQFDDMCVVCFGRK